MRLESEFPSPFSGAKFNCTCSCPGEKRESIIERRRNLCAHTGGAAPYFAPLSVGVS